MVSNVNTVLLLLDGAATRPEPLSAVGSRLAPVASAHTAPARSLALGPKPNRLSPLRVSGRRPRLRRRAPPVVSRGTFRVRGAWDSSGTPARIS